MEWTDWLGYVCVNKPKFEDIYLKFLYINMPVGQIFLISHVTDETNISSVKGLKQNLILKQRKGWCKSTHVEKLRERRSKILLYLCLRSLETPNSQIYELRGSGNPNLCPGREPKLMSRCPVWIPRLSPGDKRFDSENLLLFLSFACI